MTISSPTEDEPDRRGSQAGTADPPGGRVLIVLFLGVLMAALDIALVGPALPALTEHYGLTERSVAWVFGVFVLFNLLGLPFMARLSDVWGRRRTFALDVALFAAGTVIVATAPPYEIMLAARALQGLGASGIFPVSSAVVGDVITPAKRGRALGLLGAVFGLAFIIGPIIAGILLHVAGWQWIFLVTVPLAASILIFGLRVLPSVQSAEVHRLDWPGIALLGGALVSFAYGINQIEADRFVASVGSLDVWPYLVAAAIGAVGFVRVERRAANPLVRLTLFRSRQVVIASMMGLGAGLTEAAFVFMPAMAVAAFGVSQSTASFMLLPLVTAVAIGSPIGGRVLDRVGSRVVVVASAAVLTSGLALMGLGPLTTGTFYGASVLIGLGLSGILGSSLSYILLHEAKLAERTVAQGIGTLSISVGQISGAALIGAVVASALNGTAGYSAAFVGIAAVALLLTIFALGLKSRDAELEGATPAPVESRTTE